MSIFGKIKDAIFGHKASASPAPTGTAQPPSGQPTAQAQPTSQPQPQAQPQAQPQLQPQAARSPLDVDFTAEPATLPPEPETKRRRPALLKWGLGALIISVVAFGLWFALTQAPIPSGAPGAGGQSGTLDPDDPRSRKADRLPDAFQTPPPPQ